MKTSQQRILDVTATKACGVVQVTGTYTVEGGGSLTLEAGATLAFAAKTSLEVRGNGPGKLIVKGTATEPVTFTSAGDKAAGAWDGVYLRKDASRSSIEHLVVEYAGEDDDGGRRRPTVAATDGRACRRRVR